MKKGFKEFICKRCGKCCLNNYILLDIELKEWYKILKFIESNYNSVIEIMDDSDEYTTITTKQIKEILDLYYLNGHDDEIIYSDVFWTLDSGICPFAKKKRDNEYFCEIQDIKPKICKMYRCDLESDDYQIYLEQLKKI